MADLIRPSSGIKGFSDGVPKVNNSMTFSEIISSKSGKENISNSASAPYSMENGDVHKFGSGSFQSNYRSPPNPIPLYPVTNETNARRSRPSFLDNLNINRVLVETQMKKDEPEKDLFKSDSLLANGVEFPVSSPFYEPPLSAGSFSPSTKLDTVSSPQASEFMMSPGSGGISSKLPRLPVYENGMDMKHEFYLQPKQTEDFSTLEQVPFFIYILSFQLDLNFTWLGIERFVLQVVVFLSYRILKRENQNVYVEGFRETYVVTSER